jgi:plasmid stabilization system protein ParE
MASKTPPLIVVRSPGATEDLHNIWLWTAEHFGLSQADSYIQFLRNEISALSRGYERGTVVPGRADLRYIIVTRRPRKHGHVVIFTYDENDVYVLHVFHTAQDWLTKLA